QLSAERKLALAVDDSRFRTENRAANLRPRQTGNQPYFAALVRQSVAELDYAQVIVHVVRRDRDVVALAFLDHLARDLAADVADFAFQITDTGFARVGTN